MNATQRKTFQCIFGRPTRADVRWSSIEGLVRALGGEVTEGRGSRVRFRLGDRVATFHGPHPKRVTGKATLEDVRRFLENAGVRP
ncbi:MAG: type II toxin-antitoxin system HicA family toxin [Gemmatimonadetes bacterium]|nr:type II toxin-antitoxin system HicA family toxin [Gemmatimonadota bacterium]